MADSRPINRISEALGLRWADLDLDRGRLSVRRRLYFGVDAPKSAYGRRQIPLAPTITDHLSRARVAGS